MIEQLPFDVFLPPFIVEKEFPIVRSAQRPYSYGVNSLRVSEVWNQSRGQGVIVFVIDTEDSTKHPEVAPSYRASYSARFTNEPETTETGHGHGLHVADTILQMAPKVIIGFVKVLNNEGSGYNTWVANGIRFAADVPLLPEHAGYKRVINMSLGSNSPSPVIETAVKYARTKGVEIFAAAGNDGVDVDYPGAYAVQIITVGAIDENERPALFSSPGVQVDLGAPGVKIAGAWGKSGYASLSGTSMATPHAVGIGALILSKYTVGLERFMTDLAKDTHDPGKDDITGFGIPVATGYFTGSDPEPPEDDEPPAGERVPLIAVVVGIGMVVGMILYFVFS